MSGITSSLSDASHPGTLVSNLTYWPNGGLDTATLGNGVAETRSQDARGRVDSIADGSAYSVSIGHAPDGDVTSDTDSVNGAWAYGYDAQNRLASSSCTANCPDGAGAQAFSYTYDRYGNRWKQLVTAGSGPSPQFSFTANNNRMDGYSYDTAGDLLGDGAYTYAYDADHRLISVDNGSTASYSYNAAGQRATKTAGGVTHDYLYDLDGNMETEITNGGWSRGEAYAGGRRWATYANGTTYFEYSDWLDTARVNTQYGGGWTQTCQNDPFGDDLTCTGGTSPSPVHFTGKPRDGEDNLDYFGARYNASSLGRFMTPDWSAGAADVPYADFGNPQTLNLYGFVQNNPLTLTDTDGHCSWFGCLSQLWNDISGYDDGRQHEIGNTGLVVKNQPASGNCGNPCNVTAPPDPAETVWERINPVVMFYAGFTNLFVNNKASGAIPLALSMGAGIGGEGEAGEGAMETATGGGTAATSLPSDESQLGHIFREADGHIADTPDNRALLEGVANDPANRLGTDQYGNTWSAKTLPDGAQVWTQSRGGTIINGGLNESPRQFSPLTGLSGSSQP